MLSPLRNRFGIPGVISVIALVFAMMGGAYAASNNGGGANATASAKKSKAKKGPRGPRGKTGKTGPAGPAGPAGANGNDGQNGANGSQGPKGDKGDTGKEGDKGAKGDKGAQGDPWTAGGILPGGKTETGAWAAGFGPVGLPRFIPISFTIPLPSPLGETNVHYLKESATPTAECGGSAANPTAAPGHLCVYAGQENETEQVQIVKLDEEAFGASTAGAHLRPAFEGPVAYAYGAWAVTAEE